MRTFAELRNRSNLYRVFWKMVQFKRAYIVVCHGWSSNHDFWPLMGHTKRRWSTYAQVSGPLRNRHQRRLEARGLLRTGINPPHNAARNRHPRAAGGLGSAWQGRKRPRLRAQKNPAGRSQRGESGAACAAPRGLGLVAEFGRRRGGAVCLVVLGRA